MTSRAAAVVAALALAAAALVGCAGSPQPRASAVAPGAAADPHGLDGRGSIVDDEVAALDAAIARDLAELGLAPPDDHEVTEAMVAHQVPAIPASAAADACPAPPAGPACEDVCTLADAICGNAGRICAIADDLGEPRAHQRCAAGRLSCERARARCCGC